MMYLIFFGLLPILGFSVVYFFLGIVFGLLIRNRLASLIMGAIFSLPASYFILIVLTFAYIDSYRDYLNSGAVVNRITQIASIIIFTVLYYGGAGIGSHIR